MVNKNIQRITVTGIVSNITTIKVLDNYSYMIYIDKMDSGTWTVSADEEIVFRCRKNVKCVFELAMVFENDNIYGKEGKKLSRVEGIYLEGKDITEEVYQQYVENDKKWLLNEENLDQAKKERTNRLRWHFP